MIINCFSSENLNTDFETFSFMLDYNYDLMWNMNKMCLMQKFETVLVFLFQP